MPDNNSLSRRHVLTAGTAAISIPVIAAAGLTKCAEAAPLLPDPRAIIVDTIHFLRTDRDIGMLVCHGHDREMIARRLEAMLASEEPGDPLDVRCAVEMEDWERHPSGPRPETADEIRAWHAGWLERKQS